MTFSYELMKRKKKSFSSVTLPGIRKTMAWKWVLETVVGSIEFSPVKDNCLYWPGFSRVTKLTEWISLSLSLWKGVIGMTYRLWSSSFNNAWLFRSSQSMRLMSRLVFSTRWDPEEVDSKASEEPGFLARWEQASQV